MNALTRIPSAVPVPATTTGGIYGSTGGDAPLLLPGCPITQTDLDRVAGLRAAAIANGWPLVRVHSPWSAKAKKPGKQPVGAEWQRGHDRAALLKVSAVSANTGVITSGLRVFDFDRMNKETAAAVFDMLVNKIPALRDAPVRTRPGSTSLMVIARSTEATPPGKANVSGELGLLEVLGDGQQFVADGWHPEGGQWRWFNDRSPWSMAASSLPVIPESEVLAALEAIGASGVLGAALPGAQPQPRPSLTSGAHLLSGPRPDILAGAGADGGVQALQAGIVGRDGWFMKLPSERRSEFLRAALTAVASECGSRDGWMRVIRALRSVEDEVPDAYDMGL
ncbi:MAG: hypothetical protein EBY30_16800 [Rhodospirillales bacterium]|nr:hypothetical protein [Rhodospirillales bacterium]